MDAENKMMAFVALILFKVVTNMEVTSNEIQQLQNVVDELGANELAADEFRY